MKHAMHIKSLLNIKF